MRSLLSDVNCQSDNKHNIVFFWFFLYIFLIHFCSCNSWFQMLIAVYVLLLFSFSCVPFKARIAQLHRALDSWFQGCEFEPHGPCACVLCPWVRHFTLNLLFSTPVYIYMGTSLGWEGNRLVVKGLATLPQHQVLPPTSCFMNGAKECKGGGEKTRCKKMFVYPHRTNSNFKNWKKKFFFLYTKSTPTKILKFWKSPHPPCSPTSKSWCSGWEKKHFETVLLPLFQPLQIQTLSIHMLLF